MHFLIDEDINILQQQIIPLIYLLPCCIYRQLEIIGMRREDVLGKNFWEIFPDLVDSELEQKLYQVMLERKSTQFDFYYPAWNRWFENQIHPTTEGIAVICVDISFY